MMYMEYVSTFEGSVLYEAHLAAMLLLEFMSSLGGSDPHGTFLVLGSPFGGCVVTGARWW